MSGAKVRFFVACLLMSRLKPRPTRPGRLNGLVQHLLKVRHPMMIRYLLTYGRHRMIAADFLGIAPSLTGLKNAGSDDYDSNKSAKHYQQ
jgi:hypothetical protein